MPRLKLERVTSVLRDRIRDAAEMGAIKPGDRLPGTRRLAAELGVDPRLVASAVRRLEQEGLVVMRQQSGVYLSTQSPAGPGNGMLPREWSAEFVSQAVERGVSAHRVAAEVDRLTATDKVRAAVVAITADQAVGMVRELQEDYGIPAAAVFPEHLARAPYPKPLLRAQLIVTTIDLVPLVRKVATALGKPFVTARVRPDLFSEDWIAFMNGPVYVIVSDPRFRSVLRAAMRDIPESANVSILLAGSDEMLKVPRDARTYVTESARRMLGREGLPGRVIRPRRVFSSETVREVVAFLIAHNAGKRAP